MSKVKETGKGTGTKCSMIEIGDHRGPRGGAMATRLPIVLLAAVAAFAAAPAAAQEEEMSFAGSGAETTFSSSDVIDGRTVDTEVKLFVSAADGAGAAAERSEGARICPLERVVRRRPV